ncbi:MAG: four helix bundle protein [Ignavibacteriales bacterium]|nr:four helix bundle protein [Ignavibacteriales bacterium]
MTEYTSLKNLNRGYMKLDVWQKSIELHELVFETVDSIDADYKSKSQIIDSSQSISSNISEGYSRRSIKEYLQSLYTSLGSLSETMTRCVGFLVTKTISQDGFIKSMYFITKSKTNFFGWSKAYKRKWMKELGMIGSSKKSRTTIPSRIYPITQRSINPNSCHVQA